MKHETNPTSISLTTLIPYAICVILLGYIAYFNSAIIEISQTTIQLTAAMKGFSSSAFFFFSAMSLIPLGFFLTQVDPKYIQVVFLIGGAFGLLIIASAFTPFGLTMGRAVCGICFSCTFLTTIKSLLHHCKAISRVNILFIIYLCFIIGMVLASIPTVWLLSIVDWRVLVLIIALISLVLSILIAICVPDTETQSHCALDVISHIEELSSVVSNKKYRTIFILSSVGIGTFMSMQSLWTGQWTTEVLGFTLGHSGEILLSSAIGMFFALIFIKCFLKYFRSANGLNISVCNFFLVTSTLILTFLVFFKKFNTPVVWFLYGFVLQCFTAQILWYIKEKKDHHLLKVANVIQIGVYLYTFFIQMIVGIIINLWKYSSKQDAPEVSYRVAFSIMILFIFVSIFLSLKKRVVDETS
ncbi:MAG: MFS transporter [Rhabdochlamydiaceae bacterium]|nr:MFS transporter [Candidatus Amphrikana amoebophyrae]